MKTSSQESNTNLQKTLITAILITAVVVIALFVFRESSTAEIVINPTSRDGQVFVDKVRSTKLSSQSSTTLQVSPGDREVLISGDNTYPWKDSVSVTAGNSTTIYPFLIPQQSRQVANVPKQVKEQLDTVADNPQTKVTTPNDKIEVVVTEDGRLGARWQAASSSAPDYFSCFENGCRAIVYDNDSRVAQQISPYPNHPNAIIFATDSGVYALEIDPSGDTQNFQPITQDTQDPHFVIADNTIFVRSNNQITATSL